MNTPTSSAIRPNLSAFTVSSQRTSGNFNQQNISNARPSTPSGSTVNGAVSELNMNSSIGGNSVGGNSPIKVGYYSSQNTVITTNSKKSPSRAPIYSWEEGNKLQRQTITVDRAQFYPTKVQGLYTRLPQDEEEEAKLSANNTNNLFVDFQIVLTPEELITLAARKKAFRADAQLHKNKAVSGSPMVSTPYIDPHRVLQLRPTNSDKWIDQKGIQAYRKVDGLRL
eukprot:gene6784-9293_t